jgi:hypothetical protein
VARRLEAAGFRAELVASTVEEEPHAQSIGASTSSTRLASGP